MPWGAVAGAVIGAYAADSAGKKSARASQQATDATVAEQARQYDQTRADFAPGRELGNSAILDIQKLFGRTQNQDGTWSPQGAPNMNVFFKSPDYQFNLDQGQQAIDRSLVARGRGLSGAGVKAGARFAQGLASNEFGNFYNRLASQAGLGQAATGATASAGANAANSISQAYMANGQNRASAYTMGAQGVNNAAQGALGNYMLSRYLNQPSVNDLQYQTVSARRM